MFYTDFFSKIIFIFQKLSLFFKNYLYFSKIIFIFQKLSLFFKNYLYFSKIIFIFQKLPLFFKNCLYFSKIAFIFQKLPLFFKNCLYLLFANEDLSNLIALLSIFLNMSWCVLMYNKWSVDNVLSLPTNSIKISEPFSGDTSSF